MIRIQEHVPHRLCQEVLRYLRFLKRGHAAAQHGAAVPADLQEDLLVVSCTAALRRFQHCRQSGSVDDQPVVLEIIGQAAETRVLTQVNICMLKEEGFKCICR